MLQRVNEVKVQNMNLNPKPGVETQRNKFYLVDLIILNLVFGL